MARAINGLDLKKSGIIDNLDDDTHEWIDLGNGRQRLVRKNAQRDRPFSFRELTKDQLATEIEHPAYGDGRKTSSKSEFRRWTEQAGCVELGNDRNTPSPISRDRDVRRDVIRAYDMVKQGYRPTLSNIKEWE